MKFDYKLTDALIAINKDSDKYNMSSLEDIIEMLFNEYGLIIEANWLPNMKYFMPYIIIKSYTPAIFSNTYNSTRLNKLNKLYKPYLKTNYKEAIEISIRLAVSFVIMIKEIDIDYENDLLFNKSDLIKILDIFHECSNLMLFKEILDKY